MLVEGMPHRSIEPTSGISISTFKKRQAYSGNPCARFHNKAFCNVEVSRRRPGIAPSPSDPWRKLHEKTPSSQKIKNHWTDPFGPFPLQFSHKKHRKHKIYMDLQDEQDSRGRRIPCLTS